MVTVPVRSISVDERGVAWITGTGIKVKEVVIDKVVWTMTPEEMQATNPNPFTREDLLRRLEQPEG